MSITQTTPQQQINAYLMQQIERRKAAILNVFNYVGMTCVNEARINGSYRDRTGNLRSSVGYIVVQDGKIVNESAFSLNAGGEEGAAFIKKLAAESPHRIALIVVAGMKYAKYVEALNFNVLTSAELHAQAMVPELMKTLGFTTAT